MKRTIAILLAAVMLFGMIPLASAEAGMDNFQKSQTYNAGQFADVNASDWFAPGVQSAFELGLMKGSSDTAFKPTGNLTVAEALAIACRLHSIYADNGQSFTQGSPWYQVYVDYAVSNKIMTAGQLDPKNTITREQFAYLMCGAIPEADLNAINTITEIPDEAEKSTYGGFVYRLYRAGVLTGSDKYGTFKPTTAIQRSEVATIVTRMADKSQRKSVTLEKKPAEATEIQLAGKTQITVGESTTWTAKTLPEGTNEKVTWAAGNPSVATVDANGNIKGLKAGQCNITAKTANGVTKTVLLTVSEVAVTGINLAGQTQVFVGETTQWTATVLPENATNTWVSWTSGNPGVATVDSTGKITGIKEGDSNITVTAANGIKKTVMVHVKQATRQEMAYSFACQKIRNIGTYSDGLYMVTDTVYLSNGSVNYAFIYDPGADNALGIQTITKSESGDVVSTLFLYPNKQTYFIHVKWESSLIDVDLSGEIYAPTWDGSGESLSYSGSTNASRFVSDDSRHKMAESTWNLGVITISASMENSFESIVLKPGGYSLSDFGFNTNLW